MGAFISTLVETGLGIVAAILSIWAIKANNNGESKSKWLSIASVITIGVLVILMYIITIVML